MSIVPGKVPICCGSLTCGLATAARVSDAGMEFIRCSQCGVLRIPDENLVHHSVLPDPPGTLSWVMTVLFSLRMIWLRSVLPILRDKSVSIVDAGCGDGQFLEFLRNRGYSNVVGIEPDVARRNNALARGLSVVSESSELEINGKLSKASVVNVWQVLEHIPQPAPFLGRYAECLAPHGVMIVSVPNQKSLQTRLFGFYSAYPDYGRHIWYHDRSYLLWLKNELPNFDVSILPDFNVEYEVFSWVDSIISFATRRQNCAQKILKKGEGGILLRIGTSILAIALLPLAALLSCISLGTHHGSTLTFAIRRKRVD